MADPVLAICVGAYVRGDIDFASYDGSIRWFAATKAVMRQVDLTLDAQIAVAPAAAQQSLRAALKPWTAPAQEDDLDLAARWYMMYRPDELRRLGVPLD